MNINMYLTEFDVAINNVFISTLCTSPLNIHLNASLRCESGATPFGSLFMLFISPIRIGLLGQYLRVWAFVPVALQNGHWYLLSTGHITSPSLFCIGNKLRLECIEKGYKF